MLIFWHENCLFLLSYETPSGVCRKGFRAFCYCESYKRKIKCSKTKAEGMIPMPREASLDLLKRMTLEEKVGQLVQVPISTCVGGISEPAGPV